MRQTIRLTESELRQMIEESINDAMLEEGFKDQLVQGAKSFFGKGNMGDKNQNNQRTRSGNGGMNLGKRWTAAKENFKSQGVIDNANEIVNNLQKLVDSGICTWDSTLGEVWGAMNQNKAQATLRGSRAQNKIYK